MTEFTTRVDHTAKAFDTDLQEITRKVAEMGGLVERQISDAVQAGIAAQQRAAQIRRRNTRLALGGIGGVLVVFVVLILVATLGGGPKAAAPQTASAAAKSRLA